MLEIAGVSAYTDPAEVYWHGGTAPVAGQRLVSFWGFKVCDLAPEQAHGAVIAAVVKAVDNLTPAEFLQKHFNGVEPPNPHALAAAAGGQGAGAGGNAPRRGKD